MIKQFLSLIIVFTFPLLYGCSKDDNNPSGNFTVTTFDPVAVQKTNRTKIYAHYMPWFETKETSGDGKWGMHWTMANKNPDNIINGKREIASWYYPTIGPYASGDPDLLEYHLLLMKYSGIDGVLVDWYGIADINDAASIARNTDALFKAIEKVGLELAVVYEDRFLQGDRDQQIYQAQQDMKYLQNNYFKKDCYIKVNGKPLLLIFGPITMQSSNDWDRIFNIFTNKPVFLPLQDHSNMAGSNASGEYMWVDQNQPSEKYKKKTNFSVFFGCAYPGFRDYYKEGGWGNTLSVSWDYNNGDLYKSLLNLGKQENIDFMQLVTWNDFGEGTMIEPTFEFGYNYLKSTQLFTGVSYTEKELSMISELYPLRKQFKGDTEKNKMLDQVFYYLISLQFDKADELLKKIK